MKHQPSTLARNVSMMQCDTDNVREDIKIQDFQSNRFQKTRRSAAMATHGNTPRIYFTRSALFTALATSLVGFGMAPAALADTTNNISSPKQPTSNQIAVDQSNIQPTSTQSTTLSDDDTQLDIALDALRLKKAVEQGIIDQSVLDEYSEQSLGIKKSDAQDKSAKKPAAQGMANSQANAMDNMAGANDDLLQQAAAIQQQGYQMMTPEEIDRELAAMDMQNAQDIDDISNSTDINSTNVNNNYSNNNNDISNNDRDFDAPIATLDDTTPPIG